MYVLADVFPTKPGAQKSKTLLYHHVRPVKIQRD